MNTLTAIKRSKADLLATVRNNGMVPAVVYGAGIENTSVSVPAADFKKVFAHAGESEVVTLDIDGKKHSVLIHDVQRDPIRGHAIHIDFLSIDMNKTITVMVPVEFEGVSSAVKSGSGVLVKVMHEIEVEALPKDLPHALHISIESLENVDDQIQVKDIKAPSGVTILADAEEVVALVSALKEETEESAPIDIANIEVEKKGKKEEEAETTTE
ncbi:MAG: 50S ribosomal protein L25 [Minisyncoccia bacterium]